MTAEGARQARAELAGSGLVRSCDPLRPVKDAVND